ncbi:hypothetical protein SU69_09030 [Thermosipho melanesiensis]|uniref:Multiple resistance and pH regulation protein F n=2 Tax=Thermosipho melanesiensis TaxID=46541 RepID=A6LNX2_THEM4|nr:hypothetical protein [Thermosipho melanesiensis]ABR31623.1 hypothetical protein Tmel_1788 [Thermosipho melanesiensis BI429]APT74652.1 hypothetical protein BW47_09410 [Thermosipho melanesiensis]OOC35151.1 hypothetical protein SU69_09030 [Thermosipho melanesiensis]OOC35361.1 hypothetical protein SU70_09040 [Thermosipho melanesiensis]OOC36612.1 hypothetical protein SU68_09100 [Thermosipho melanesiensis]
MISLVFVVFSIFLTILGIGCFKNIYEKIIPLLSISTKISILIILYSYYKNIPIIIDIGVLYMLLSIGGAFVITSFISRSDL